MGSGLLALGQGQIASGDEVSEAQLQLLVGMGREPVAGMPLGRVYPVYKTIAQRIEDRTAALDLRLDPVGRARAITTTEVEAPPANPPNTSIADTSKLTVSSDCDRDGHER